jgi:broad specificity phosphatase PhoE
MRFYLIRHGQTAWNAESRVMGRGDTPLDSVGEKQVADLAKALGHFSIQTIFSSPQLRAQQTAQALAVVKNLPVHSDERLSELDFPRWQGKVHSEIKDDEVYISRKKDFFNFRHPEIENYDSLMKRIGEFTSEIEKSSGDIAVVSHGDVVKAFIVKLMNVAPESFFQFKIQNASCTVLIKENDRWIMELMNYTPIPLAGLNI